MVASLCALLSTETLRKVYAFSDALRGLSVRDRLIFWSSQLGRVPETLSDASHYSHHYFILVGVYGGLLLALPLRKQYSQGLMFLLSVWSGFVAAWASSNGLINFAIGGLPAFLITVTAFQSAFNHARLPLFLGSLLSGLFTLALVYLMITLSWPTAYSDARLDELSTQISSGPYKGLYTTQQKAASIEFIQGRLKLIDDGVSSVIFMYEFPAGYLMTRMRPETRMLFLNRRSFPDSLRKLLLPMGNTYPDYVVYVGEDSWLGGDPVLNAAYSAQSGHYEEVDRSFIHLIYRRLK